MKVLPKYLWEGYRDEIQEYIEVINRQVDTLDYFWQLPEISGFRMTCKVILRYTLGMVDIVRAIKDGTGDLYSDTLPDIIICEPSMAAPMSLDQFNSAKMELRDTMDLVKDKLRDLERERMYIFDWQESCEAICSALALVESRTLSLYMSK